tara:strand:+ start:133 stop:339 length:207 start_codon:yes stop_codon:yes gene_type:complete
VVASIRVVSLIFLWYEHDSSSEQHHRAKDDDDDDDARVETQGGGRGLVESFSSSSKWVRSSPTPSTPI